MGYDMSVISPTKESVEKKEEGRKEFQAAVKARDAATSEAEKTKLQEAVSEAYNKMSDEDTTYFRLNIWGMGKMRQVMDEAGILSWEDHGEFPKNTWDEEKEENTPEGTAFLSTASVEPDKVPAYKFGSNDGWVVTPRECLLISSKLADYVTSKNFVAPTGWEGEDLDDIKKWVARWGVFNRSASECDGYQVY